MYTIATAGHIDHGKSSLVKALTGTDPDRLPEEKRREMTIDLGFASFKLPSGEPVGIIDVPGHERFIKTMIAGVGTLDLVMFIVAADDGWMPQSQEHLSILSYLGLEQGLIVLTKVDLVDREWVELIKTDLETRVTGTFLEDKAIIEFAATDHRNLDEIRTEVERILKGTKRPDLLDSARLFVDRSFTVAGTGTVVTGTLREGSFAVGRELVHHPSGEKVKIKGLESFYSHLQEAPPGIRLAVGLQSFSREQINRGDLLFYPDRLKSSKLLGVKLYPESDQAHYIKHGRRIVLLHGTSEIDGTLVVPPEEHSAGDGGQVVGLKLDEPVVALAGDHYVLRLPTPSLLVAGGVIIDPLLAPFKRSHAEVWNLLVSAASLKPADLLNYELTAKQLVRADELLIQSTLTAQTREATVARLTDSKAVLKRGRYLIAKQVWDDQGARLLELVESFHQQNPHLQAMSLAELQSQASCPPAFFELLVDNLLSQSKLDRFEAGIKLKAYAAGLSGNLGSIKDDIVKELQDPSRLALSRKEIFAFDKKANEIYAFLKQQGQIIDISGMVYLRETYDRLVGIIVKLITDKGRITVAEARDATSTTRKVILPILEEMDRQRITRRDGDHRELSQ